MADMSVNRIGDYHHHRTSRALEKLQHGNGDHHRERVYRACIFIRRFWAFAKIVSYVSSTSSRASDNSGGRRARLSVLIRRVGRDELCDL